MRRDDTLLTASERDEKAPIKHRSGKWRTTVSLGALLALLVLLTNIGVLAWAKGTYGDPDGIATVYEGT